MVSTTCLASLVPRVITQTNQHWKVSDLINQGQWKVNILASLLPSNILQDILGKPLPLTHGHCDTIVWAYHSSGQVTVKSVYTMLADIHWDHETPNTVWKKLWNLKCPPKLKFFMWSLVQNKLPTRDILSKKTLAISGKCPLCGHNSETYDYLFRMCEVVKPLFALLTMKIGIQWPDATVGLSWFSTLLKLNSNNAFAFTYGVFLLWHIWLNRNLKVFQLLPFHPYFLLRNVFFKSQAFLEHTSSVSAVSYTQPCYVYWLPPPMFWVKMNTDGAANQLTAGIGIVLRNETGAFIAGFSGQLGRCSNDLAELWAIRNGLKLAKELDIKKLIVESDSLFVVQALTGKCSYGWQFVMLVQDCKILCEDRNVVFVHVYRKGNQPADLLAKRTLRGQANNRWFTTPDAGLGYLLYLDNLSSVYTRE